VNVKAPFLLTAAIAPKMVARGVVAAQLKSGARQRTQRFKEPVPAEDPIVRQIPRAPVSSTRE
jgi:hypothetical protein